MNRFQLARSGGGARTESRYSFEEYIAQVSQLGLSGGLIQSWAPDKNGRQTERSDSPFEHWVANAYKANGIVFACQLARLLLFSEARFQFQQIRGGRPGDLFGTPDLALLEQPWVNGSTGELLARMIQDADLAGNAYIRRTSPLASISALERLRPDWVSIVLGTNSDLLNAEVIGYLYEPGGAVSRNDPIALAREEVAHWSPIPDPIASYRGMSWLSPVLREIRGDNSATDHKQKFFDNGGTVNMVVKFDAALAPEKLERFKELMEADHRGVANAYRTLYLGGGADATVVGADFKQMDFRAVQGAGETRVAAAAGVPPVIVGLSEGLQAATYCLPADELVWTTGGPKRMVDVVVGEQVWSHFDGALVPRRVTWWGRTGQMQVFEVRTKNRAFHATGNHPVLTRRPGNSLGANSQRSCSVEWMRVDALQPGDEIVQVMETPDLFASTHTPDGDATPDLMMWLGAYVGDGSGAGSRRGGMSLAFPPTDRCRDHYEKLTAMVFPGLHIGYGPRSFHFNSVALSARLAALGFAGRATTKELPAWLFTLKRDLRLAFLAGVVDSDGHIDKRGTLKIQLSNRHLVEQIKMLLVSCGIETSNLYEAVFDASVLPSPGLKESYVSWAIVASSADRVAEIPFSDWLYRERVEENTGRWKRCGGDAAKAGLSSDLGFFHVRSIAAGPVVPVYDISVEEGASFVAGGVVVHNSNYAQARRRFADMTIRPLWRSASAALASIIRVPSNSRLWYDDRDIPALQEDEKDAAEIESVKSTTIANLVREGFEPDSVVKAVMAQDMSLLVHSGRVSVQLLEPGEQKSSMSTNGHVPQGVSA